VKIIFIVMFAAAFIIPQSNDVLKYVDPFIGTADH
jgi:hypothetical protein